MDSKILNRFESKIHKSNKCWDWLASKDRQGYGYFGINRKIKKAHRVAYEQWVGRIPFGLSILHRCDNPPCVNPEHLFLGTKSDNSRDAFDKGRLTQIGLGEHSMAAKLNNESVLFVKASQESNSNLARRLGVDRGTIRAIRVGKSWKHLLDLTN